jgi:paraquat-inducible protein B
MGAGGVQVNTESLQALLTGGIAFDTPVAATDDPQAPPGTTFQLYPNRTAMGEADFFEKFPFLMYFNGSVRGLEKGAPVEFRGIRVGSVTDVEMLIDIQAKTVQIPVHIVIEPQRVKRIGTPFKDAYEGINALVEKGMRGQLKVGNLLTGQLYVSLDFYPDLPRATLIRRKGEPPEIPTVPTELEEITRSVSLVLERLASLPLEGLVEDARKMTQAIERLAATPDIPLAVESIRQAAEAAEVTLAQATSALAATEGLVGPRSQVRTDLVGLMNELKNAARSVRVLTNYLERHPEALIHGKGGPRK